MKMAISSDGKICEVNKLMNSRDRIWSLREREDACKRLKTEFEDVASFDVENRTYS